MATYKVLQDLDAEDKLVGPFTFKQIVLLLIAGFLGFIMFLLAQISIILIAIPMPFFLVCLFFGIYRRKDQSVETYVAAILRFYFKPRKRIWDKDGILETVKVTAPPTVDEHLTDDLSRDEVRGKLKDLGTLMDTRGWSAKNTTLQESGAIAMQLQQSDRIAVPNAQQQPTEVHQSDDIFASGVSSPTQNLTQMSQDMQERARQQAISQMQASASQKSESPKVHKASPDGSQQGVPTVQTVQQNSDFPTPIPNPQNSSQQVTQSKPPQTTGDKSSSTMTTDVPADIINLSNNNDRSIESIAKEADEILESGDTISLHGH